MSENIASTSINASSEAVWSVLIAVDKWPEWDPFCERIEGAVGLGNTIKAFTKLSPGRAFPVKVTELVPNERMTWTGGLPLGLFKGERTFVLESVGDTTTFVLREKFSGPMLRIIGRSIPDLSEAFEAFVSGLKARVEAEQ